MVLTGVIFAATMLTMAMFLSRQGMLGFPCAIFWALTGGYAYTLSVTAWDIYFIFAFACLLGMTTFSMFAAYALRTKKEEAEEGDLYFDEGGDRDVKFIDEGGSSKSSEAATGESEKPGRRSRGIRDRANRRRTRWD